jgi:hypothetical protein
LFSSFARYGCLFTGHEDGLLRLALQPRKWSPLSPVGTHCALASVGCARGSLLWCGAGGPCWQEPASQRHVRVCAPLCERVRVCARADGDHTLGRRQGHVHRHQRHRAPPVAAVRVCALPHRHGAAALPGPLLVAGVFFGARYCFACRPARVSAAIHPRMYPTSSVHSRPAPTSPSPLCACTCGRPCSGFFSPWLVIWPLALRVCA